MAIYKTIQGDTWDMIAKKVYGNEKYLDYLMANNHKLLEHFVFSAGIEVAVPDLAPAQEENMPEWRR